MAITLKPEKMACANWNIYFNAASEWALNDQVVFHLHLLKAN